MSTSYSLQQYYRHNRWTLIILVLLGVLITSCGYDGPSESRQNETTDPNTGSFSCSLVWPEDVLVSDNGAGVSRAVDCQGSSIDTIVFTLFDSSNNLLTAGTLSNPKEFECEAHSGLITGIPPGNNYSVEVTAEDGQGNTHYRTNYGPFGITVGLTTSPDFELQMEECATEICDDGIDNDCDNTTDCSDADCTDDVACSVHPDTYTNSFGMTFKLISAGTFTMGSPLGEFGRSESEIEHDVTLTQNFYMQTTEVTQGQWEAVMGSNPSNHSSCGSDCPVEQVSWDDAQEFIDTLNNMGEGTYSLPTEAQWEYAARAGSTTAFANGDITVYSSWGDCNYDSNLDDIGWYCYNSGDMTHTVAQKDANAWGLYDMHGNVTEWVQDWWGTYPSSSVTDPTGPATGSIRIERGGYATNNAYRMRSAARFSNEPNFRGNSVGFRLLRMP